MCCAVLCRAVSCFVMFRVLIQDQGAVSAGEGDQQEMRPEMTAARGRKTFSGENQNCCHNGDCGNEAVLLAPVNRAPWLLCMWLPGRVGTT